MASIIRRTKAGIGELENILNGANDIPLSPDMLARAMVVERVHYPLPWMLDQWRQGRLNYEAHEVIQLVFAYRNHLPDGGRAPIQHEQSIATSTTSKPTQDRGTVVERQGARKGRRKQG